ncbi:hypothetical protein DMUE_5162 [Dictyocoela muelleri]|nr:hypothetical protein DMUE_5162 [Dictyocoela muelleri]
MSRHQNAPPTNRSSTKNENNLNKRFSLNLSLYNFLIHSGRVPRGHDMLSLTIEKDRYLKKSKEVQYEPARATFKLTPPGTTLEIQRSIPLLEDIPKQDVFTWKKEILETAALAQWDESTAIQVVKSISATNILPLFTTCSTLDDIFKTIMKQKYPESDALKYMTTLTTIRQNNYPTIEEYKLEIEDNCRKLMTCLGGDTTAETLKIRETFYNGLSDRTKLEMARLNIKDINQMYQIISSTEKTIIDQSRTINNEPSNNKDTISKNNQHRYNKGKWCSYHKMNTHDTKECRAIKSSNDKDKLYKT